MRIEYDTSVGRKSKLKSQLKSHACRRYDGMTARLKACHDTLIAICSHGRFTNRPYIMCVNQWLCNVQPKIRVGAVREPPILIQAISVEISKVGCAERNNDAPFVQEPSLFMSFKRRCVIDRNDQVFRLRFQLRRDKTTQPTTYASFNPPEAKA